MYRKFVLLVSIAVLGVTGFGQKQKTEPIGDQVPADSQKSSSKSPSKSSSKSTSANPESMLSAGTSLEAELRSTLDVRKSKVGDEVLLKTTRAIKQNGETIVPKGAELIGRVTEVQQKTKQNAVSKIGVVFDRIQGKDLNAPLNASIVSVASAQASAAAGDLFATNASGSSSTTASSSGSSGGGGLLGGAGSTVGGLGSTLGGVVNTTAQTVGGVAGTATNVAGQTTGSALRTVNGLQISSSASGSAAGASTILSQGKDVRIEKGASFQLMVNGSGQGQ